MNDATMTSAVSELVQATHQLVLATNYEPDQTWAKRAALSAERVLARFEAIPKGFAWYAGPSASVLEDELLILAAAQNPFAAPDGYLLIRREEAVTRAPSGEIKEAALRLWFDVITAGVPNSSTSTLPAAVCGHYIRSWEREQVALTVHGVDELLVAPLPASSAGPLGHVFATRLMQELVHWAQRWPAAEIGPIARAPTNSPSRIEFYNRFGFQLEQDATVYEPLAAAALVEDHTGTGALHRRTLERVMQTMLSHAHSEASRSALLEANLAATSTKFEQFRKIARRAALTALLVIFALLIFHR